MRWRRAVRRRGPLLLAQDLLGPEGSDRGVFAVWTEVLPAIGARLADAPAASRPRSRTRATTSRRPQVRLDAYVAECVRLLPRAPSFDALIAASTVLAWRSGLAQARAAAREAFRSLPGRAGGAHPRRGSRGRARARSARSRRARRSVARPGAGRPSDASPRGPRGGFRPFGGRSSSPRASGASGTASTRDRAACVEVHADVFGATWTACGERPPSGVVENGPPWAAGASGDVAMGRVRTVRGSPGGGGARGTSSTLAVVLRHSHQVHLVALAPEGA
jgi:hypothetical protein